MRIGLNLSSQARTELRIQLEEPGSSVALVLLSVCPSYSRRKAV